MMFSVLRAHVEAPVVHYLLILGSLVWWNHNRMAVNLKSRIMNPSCMALMWIPPPAIMIGNQMLWSPCPKTLSTNP